jgi:hypothetical protein
MSEKKYKMTACSFAQKSASFGLLNVNCANCSLVASVASDLAHKSFIPLESKKPDGVAVYRKNYDSRTCFRQWVIVIAMV